MTTNTSASAIKTAAAPKTKSPAARKPRVPRKPLTPETTVSTSTEAPVATDYAVPGNISQRDALVNSYWMLKESGLDIPDAIRIPVEKIIEQVQDEQAEAQKAIERTEHEHQERIEHLNETGPVYIRNMTHTEFNLRLDSQQGTGNIRPRRIQLKPRGMRGDMHPIKDEDHQDPILITNMSMGLLELIPAGVAQQIIEKQTRNMNQQRVHPAMQVLSNEYKTLKDNHVDVANNPTFKIEAEYNSQGITVSTVDPRMSQPGFSDKERSRSGDLQGGLSRVREPAVQSQFIPTNGQPASIQIGASNSPEGVRKLRDDIARRKDLEGPAAGLGNVRVVVEPPQRA